MPKLLVSMIIVLGFAGLALFNWSLFAANATYQGLRAALAGPASGELAGKVLSDTPHGLGGYFLAGLLGAIMYGIAFKLYRIWHAKYGKPAFPPTAA